MKANTQRELNLKLSLAFVLVSFAICMAQDDGEGSEDCVPGDSTWTINQWFQYK
jgi:hypothetical protein